MGRRPLSSAVIHRAGRHSLQGLDIKLQTSAACIRSIAGACWERLLFRSANLASGVHEPCERMGSEIPVVSSAMRRCGTWRRV